MEPSQPVSIDSFSYRWLVTLESLENSLTTSLDASDNESLSSYYIEMDPRLPPSKRFFRSSQDSKFDFPNSQSDDAISNFVHADELISNGYLMPLFADPSNIESCEVLSTRIQNVPIFNSSQYSPQPDLPACSKNSDCTSLTRCRRLSKWILKKYFNFLRPLYRRIRGDDKASSNYDNSVERVKNRPAYYADDYWRRSCDSDSSIFEAVLHCKRSIEKVKGKELNVDSNGGRE